MGITGNDRAWKEELTAGEIFFCLFFGTLLLAKGVGLYDGQGVFRIFLLIASAFWGLKMLTTEWEIREILASAILLLLGWMAYRSSGEKAALVSMMVITGMKGVSVRKVFRTGLVIWTGCFVVTVLLALTGTIEPLMLVHNKAGLGYVIRNSLGYTHPNVLHISYVILLAFWFYTFQWTGKSCGDSLSGKSLYFCVFFELYRLCADSFLSRAFGIYFFSQKKDESRKCAAVVYFPCMCAGLCDRSAGFDGKSIRYRK